ncbi:MAG TPA: HPF/RaiA family ribosome-associated protein [Terriglobales bacterium]|nr:HPF/RaiA family ribosome-associated protein [Terriglobales bacterium]
MQIDVRTHSLDLAEVLKSYLERRLRFALSRFGERVGQITVRLSRNARTEVECRISTELKPFGRVAVEEADTDLFAAIDRATGRIGRLFGRELQRTHDARVGRESVRLAA